MRSFVLAASAAAAVFWIAGTAMPHGAAAAEASNFTAVPMQAPSAPSVSGKAKRHVADNACGLCSTTDCCGGASLGWKLCQDGCPSGQKKCMMVATCP